MFRRPLVRGLAEIRLHWGTKARGREAHTVRDELGHANEESQADNAHEDHGVLEDAENRD